MLFLTSFKCLLVLFLVWWISLYLCLLSYSFVPSHISSSVFAYPFCTFSVIFISVIYLNYHTLLLQCNIIIHNTFILLQGNLATQAEIHTSAQSSSKMSLPLSSTSGIWNAPTVNTFLFFFFPGHCLLFSSHISSSIPHCFTQACFLSQYKKDKLFVSWWHSDWHTASASFVLDVVAVSSTGRFLFRGRLWWILSIYIQP